MRTPNLRRSTQTQQSRNLPGRPAADQYNPRMPSGGNIFEKVRYPQVRLSALPLGPKRAESTVIVKEQCALLTLRKAHEE